MTRSFKNTIRKTGTRGSYLVTSAAKSLRSALTVTSTKSPRKSPLAGEDVAVLTDVAAGRRASHDFESQKSCAKIDVLDTRHPKSKASDAAALSTSISAAAPLCSPGPVAIQQHSSDDPSSFVVPASNILSTILPDTGLAPSDSQWRTRAWKTLRRALAVLKDVSVVFPPLQAAASALMGVLEQIEEIACARHDLNAVATRIEALAKLLGRYRGGREDEDMQDRLSGMAVVIAQVAQKIKAKLAPGVRRIFIDSLDAHEILEYISTVSFLITIFEVDTALNTEAKVAGIKKIVSELHDSYILEKLRPVAGSLYNDLGSGGECMPGTRAGILAELMAWAPEYDGPSVYFLTGMAGAGKSAIARSFAKLLDSQAMLGASFFCSRASDTRSNVAGIIPSVAFHLAYHSKPFAEAIIGAIRNAPGVSFHHRAPVFQFTALILPLAHILPDDRRTSVVIIDALDECSGLNVARELLGVVLRFSSHSTSGIRLKFFITSRPEPLIETAFAPELSARSLRLHDVEADIVSADVEKYPRKNLRDVARRVYAPEWPTPWEMTELISRTGKLFIFAFTVVQYLSPPSLSRAESAAVDALYGQILDAAWEGKESSEIRSSRRALTTLICLREPLPMLAICTLLKEDPENLDFLLADFHSVIDIPRSIHSPVLIFHASFPDYLTDNHQSGNNTLDAQAHHAVLALQCINCMNSLLSENMCGIARPDSLSQIAEAVLDNSIPYHLRYAALYWATHISMMPLGTPDTNMYLYCGDPSWIRGDLT
ncbi:hypothetical protein DFH06DRAFT_1396916 [Mycena polygramma]|nr:hypothetical protein DFH06DRAFT_1396916 [Mycena polygramma]